jgi:hypothetical protein
MDGIDLKTLSQFYLLGDPSVHPVTKTSVDSIPKGVATAIAEHISRAERREKMKMSGAFLINTKPTASKQVPTGALSQKTRVVLSNIVKKAGLSKEQKFTAFAVKEAHVSKSQSTKIAKAPMRYLIAIGSPKREKIEKIRQGVAIVAKELGGRIVDYRIYHQR